MEFFEVIEHQNFFNPLYSGNPNKEFYIRALMLLWQDYVRNNGLLKRKQCIESLIANFDTSFYSLKAEEDRQFEDNNIYGRARYLLDKLIDAGWFVKEDTVDFEDINILVPEYSRKFLDAIYEVEHASELFKRFASSIYANLKTAREEQDSIYQHFSNAAGDTFELHQSLLSMSHKIKMAYEKLLEQVQANGVLEELSKYIDTIEETYHSLKTDENIYRYKIHILQILSDFEFDEGTLTLLAKQMMVRETAKKFDGVEAAKGEVLSLINQMRETFSRIDRAINNIDKKNQQYVGTTAERVRYLLNRNKDFKGNLIKLITTIAESSNKETYLQLVSEKLLLSSLENITYKTFFKPLKRKTQFISAPINIDINSRKTSKYNKEVIIEENRKKKLAKFGTQKIIAWLEKKFKGQNSFNTKEMILQDDTDFTMLVLAYHLISKNDTRKKKKVVPYHVIKKNNRVLINNRYRVPEIIFAREAE